MKKKFSIPTYILLFIAGIVLTASTFQEKGNKGKNDKAQQNKGNQKANGNSNKADNAGNPSPGKGNQGNKGINGNGNGNGNVNGNGNGNGKGNGNGQDNAKDNGRGNNKDIFADKGKGNNGNRGRANAILKNNWYSWTSDNFRDRSKIRGKDKVTICHKVNGSEPVNIRVSANALNAHRNHGDVVGDCPAVNNSIFSDIFQRRRTTYYNDLEYSQDQYYYSNSVLDYALSRLTSSRSQLDQMKANNAAQADIERRQASVVQLEENVSLLETALGIAGQLLVDRL